MSSRCAGQARCQCRRGILMTTKRQVKGAVVAAKLSDPLRYAVAEMARDHGQNVSDVLRDALKFWLHEAGRWPPLPARRE